jgi:hypothetical protein
VAVTFDAVSSNLVLASSLTLSHNIPIGIARLLVVCTQTNGDVTAVTYGGTSLTLAGEIAAASGNRVEMWYLVDPPAGAQDVVVTAGTATNVAAGAVSFSGVDPVSPVGTFVSDANAGTTASVAVAGSSEGYFLDGICMQGGDDGTPTPPQTGRWEIESTIQAEGSTKPGALSTTMEWTLFGSDWALGALPILPLPGADAYRVKLEEVGGRKFSPGLIGPGTDRRAEWWFS